MLRKDYEGQAAPNKITDPIGYAIWREANQCPECRGTGHYLPKSDTWEEMCQADFECQECHGEGVTMYDPNF